MPSQLTSIQQDWFTHRRVLSLVMIAGSVLTFYLCYLLVVPFLPAFAWALALAVVARPLHAWILRWVPNCNLAALLAVLLVTVILLIPTAFVTHRLILETGKTVETVQSEHTQAMTQKLLAEFPQLGSTVAWVQDNVDLRGEAKRLVQSVAGEITSLISGSIGAIVQLALTLFMLFFFFRDRQAILDGVRSFLPLTSLETDAAFRRIRDTVHATIYGTVAVRIVQGTLGGLMFWWLGLPSPVLWGIVMAVLGFIPILGAFIIWVPAVCYLALEGMWVKAAILTVWGAIVIGFIDNLLYPILVGTRLRLHTLTAFIAILGGLAVFGAAGMILGPVIVAVALAVIDTWRLRLSEAGSLEAGLKEEEINPPVPPPTSNSKNNFKDPDEPQCSDKMTR
jgi:predicted PurR-regulated permease PerM